MGPGWPGGGVAGREDNRPPSETKEWIKELYARGFNGEEFIEEEPFFLERKHSNELNFMYRFK